MIPFQAEGADSYLLVRFAKEFRAEVYMSALVL
jgi:hypothetical protein